MINLIAFFSKIKLGANALKNHVALVRIDVRYSLLQPLSFLFDLILNLIATFFSSLCFIAFNAILLITEKFSATLPASCQALGSCVWPVTTALSWVICQQSKILVREIIKTTSNRYKFIDHEEVYFTKSTAAGWTDIFYKRNL